MAATCAKSAKCVTFLPSRVRTKVDRLVRGPCSAKRDHSIETNRSHLHSTVSSDRSHALRNLCFIAIKQRPVSGATHWQTAYQVKKSQGMFCSRDTVHSWRGVVITRRRNGLMHSRAWEAHSKPHCWIPFKNSVKISRSQHCR